MRTFCQFSKYEFPPLCTREPRIDRIPFLNAPKDHMSHRHASRSSSGALNFQPVMSLSLTHTHTRIHTGNEIQEVICTQIKSQPSTKNPEIDANGTSNTFRHFTKCLMENKSDERENGAPACHCARDGRASAKQMDGQTSRIRQETEAGSPPGRGG